MLLRETALDDALAVAERLRAAVEHVSLHGRSRVVEAVHAAR